MEQEPRCWVLAATSQRHGPAAQPSLGAGYLGVQEDEAGALWMPALPLQLEGYRRGALLYEKGALLHEGWMKRPIRTCAPTPRKGYTPRMGSAQGRGPEGKRVPGPPHPGPRGEATAPPSGHDFTNFLPLLDSNLRGKKKKNLEWLQSALTLYFPIPATESPCTILPRLEFGKFLKHGPAAPSPLPSPPVTSSFSEVLGWSVSWPRPGSLTLPLLVLTDTSQCRSSSQVKNLRHPRTTKDFSVGFGLPNPLTFPGSGARGMSFP